jgi:hypothetical protein
MRLGTYLGIFGTIFGNALVAVILYLITSGNAYHAPDLLQDAKVNPPAEEQTASSFEVNTSDASNSQSVASSDTDCTLSNRFPEKVRQWCGLIEDYSQQRGLEPDLVAAVILQESGGNSDAYSSSGAVGLMQIMPRDGIAAGFMCKNGPCFSARPSTSELQDPEYNIAYGTKMLASLEKRYGSMREALKAYGPMDMGYQYADIVLGHYDRYSN